MFYDLNSMPIIYHKNDFANLVTRFKNEKKNVFETKKEFLSVTITQQPNITIEV